MYLHILMRGVATFAKNEVSSFYSMPCILTNYLSKGSHKDGDKSHIPGEVAWQRDWVPREGDTREGGKVGRDL